MLRFLARGRLVEKRGERRRELRLGIALAVRRVEEAPAVDQAGMAGPQQIGPVVAEIEPLPAGRQALGTGAEDQLGAIVGCRRERLLAGGPRAPEERRDEARDQPPR